METHIREEVSLPTISLTPSLVSAAAFLVNMMARFEVGKIPCAIKNAIHRVNTRVVPKPGPTTTNSGSSPWLIALACGVFRSASRLIAIEVPSGFAVNLLLP